MLVSPGQHHFQIAEMRSVAPRSSLQSDPAFLAGTAMEKPVVRLVSGDCLRLTGYLLSTSRAILSSHAGSVEQGI